MKPFELIEPENLTHDLVVVAFDMCSSSKLIEDLTRTGNLSAYDKLLQNFHVWISSNAKSTNYAVYKFTGDGWILLFPIGGIDGAGLMSFLVTLSTRYNSLREKIVDCHLESLPEARGLTFGVDMGPLHKILLGTDVEFVGRAINVACRLQSAVKDKGPEPDYRILFSRTVFNALLKDVRDCKFFEVERSLRNISGGERYRCMKANLSGRLLST